MSSSLNNINSTLTTTVNLTQLSVIALQNQINNISVIINTVQSSITGMSELIQNITNINAIQTAEITALKSQSGAASNGALYCKMSKRSILSGLFYNSDGYCTNLQLCCQIQWHSNSQRYLKRCFFTTPSQSVQAWYTDEDCGVYIQF
ncbi:Hypothetical_protein [Hexamita inflata]|uniref:Hypothetical_protein n=1 Tax=Hexamita inflata TaxID=28002 RepID=A0AA86TD80_9EUKA|nr:Hypothetical protein HINF_LOCUS2235 [Hexamita inflata]